MLVPLQVLWALRVIGVIGVPAPVCNSSDQLDLLQTSSSEVAVTKMKVRTLDSETCSTEDGVSLAEIESELEVLTSTIWDIADNVKELMENVTGEQQDKYDDLSANGCTTPDTDSWGDRLMNAGKVLAQGFQANLGSDFAKMASKSVASLIPYAGSIFSSLLELFWPSLDGSYDIWELIVGQVQDLVDESILKAELGSRQADLWAVKRDLMLFTKASTNAERRNFLSIALAKVEDVMAHLTTSSNHQQFIPLSIATATLHCTILRMRVDVGMEVYGSYDPSWKATLQGAVAYYQTYFNYTYGEWYKWRRGKLSTSPSDLRRRRACQTKLSDSISGHDYVVDYVGGMNDFDNVCDGLAQDQKDRTTREYSRDIIKALQSVMQLQRFIPGMESAQIQVLPAIEYVTLGPFAPYTQFIDSVTFRSHWPNPSERESNYACQGSTTGPGDIDKITVRSGSDIDMIQINYKDGQECASGGSGGDATEIDLSNKYVQGISEMCFDDYHMTHMTMTFSDGSEKSFGKGSCIVSSDGTITGDQSYRLVGAQMNSVSMGGPTLEVVMIEPMYQFVGLPVSTSSKPFTFKNDTMTSGEILYAKDGLQSADNAYTFLVQEDANLVVYDSSSSAIWYRSDVAPNDCPDTSTLQLRLQGDGNLVLYCGDTVLWAANTVSSSSSSICRVLAMQNDGQLALYNVGDQSGVWSSSGSVPIGFGPVQLTSPDSLGMGQRLVRNFYGNKAFEFGIEDGQPVVNKWPRTVPIWSAGSSCSETSEAHLTLQEDGNLVLYCDKANTIIPWATNTADPSLIKLSGVNKLILDADGALMLIDKKGLTTWSSAGEEYKYFAAN